MWSRRSRLVRTSVFRSKGSMADRSRCCRFVWVLGDATKVNPLPGQFRSQGTHPSTRNDDTSTILAPARLSACPVLWRADTDGSRFTAKGGNAPPLGGQAFTGKYPR